MSQRIDVGGTRITIRYQPNLTEETRELIRKNVSCIREDNSPDTANCYDKASIHKWMGVMAEGVSPHDAEILWEIEEDFIEF